MWWITFCHILQSLPVHNWQEHDDNDLAQARKEIFLDVFKGFFIRHARQGVWQNQCVIRMMSGLCTWDVKWHIMLLTFQHWFYFIVRGFSWCLFVCLLVLGSCVKVRSIVTIRCHTLHWVYLFWFFFQRGTVLCMSSQRLFHGKFVFGALVRSKKTFGGWFQICSISCPCWGLGKKSNGLRCFFLLASFNYLLWFSNRRTP